MTEHDDLRALLRRALPPVEDRPAIRDCWPEIRTHEPPPSDWTWLDLGATAAIAILLALFPGCLWLLLYHL